MNIPGSNVRILRESMGLSLRSLASAAGMDVAALSRLEAGKSSGRKSSLERLAKALAVSYETLFAPIEMVEAAALRMRNVPILEGRHIEEWTSGNLEPDDEQPVLHADLKRTSRMAFAFTVTDQANAPAFEKGQHLIFDPRSHPKPGDTVLAQDAVGSIFIGRYRPMPSEPGHEAFEVVPMDPIQFPIGSSRTQHLKLRGRLIESRRYF